MSDHKRFRAPIVKKFMESEGYKKIRRGEGISPEYRFRLGEKGRLYSAQEIKNERR